MKEAFEVSVEVRRDKVKTRQSTMDESDDLRGGAREPPRVAEDGEWWIFCTLCPIIGRLPASQGLVVRRTPAEWRTRKLAAASGQRSRRAGAD
jgi:hypothetical protein